MKGAVGKRTQGLESHGVHGPKHSRLRDRPTPDPVRRTVFFSGNDDDIGISWQASTAHPTIPVHNAEPGIPSQAPPAITLAYPDGILRAACEAVRVGICLVDAEGRFTIVNPEFCRMTGFTAEEFIGQPWTIAAPADIAAKAGAFLRAVLADSARIPDRWKLKRKDGTLIDALVSFRPLQHEGRQYAVLSFSDITEAKRADDRLRDLNRDLERGIAERTAVIRRNRNVLLQLAALEKHDRLPALQAILGAGARTLEIERVSYWQLAGDASAIECEMLYVLSGGGIDATFAGTRLTAGRYPAYFAAIVENRPVVAPQAQTDPATAEFAADYLVPRGISSMLDVPVWLRGKVVGVLCHEHVGPAREWTAEDIDFASSAAMMISLALEEARRHELNDALVRSEEKYRHVVENANEAIVIAQDGRIRYANPQTSRLSGYPPEALDNKPFLEFVYAEDRALVAENYMKRLRGEQTAASYDFRIVDMQGRVRWLNINAVTLEWDGRPATLNFLTDVTETKTLQQDLQRNLAEREALLQSALVGISFAVNRRLTWVNETYARMLGFSRGELVGQLSRVHYPDDASYEAFGASAYPVLSSGLPFENELQMRRKDGALIWVHVYGIAVDPGDLGKGSIWTNIDITERRRAEEEVRRALAKERELNELKSRFVAMTSHEFRTPLATILSSTELLERHYDRLPASERGAIFSRITAGVGRMAQMLDNVLTIGRAETDAMHFQPAPLDLRGLCRQLAEETHLQHGGNRDLRLEFSGLTDAVDMDEKLLRHALGNLLSNALKYSTPGSRTTLAVHVNDNMATFKVTDEGIGIPLQDQEHLFEAFHRARNVGNIPGTGLGLAIVRKSVELHGGTIAFISEPGRGTRFTVRIPLARR